MKRILVLLLSLLLPLAAQEKPLTPKKIVVTGRGVSYIPDMKQLAPNITFVEGREDNRLKEIADADAYLGDITPELFAAAKKLKWVHIFSAGVEQSRFPAFINSNVMLT